MPELKYCPLCGAHEFEWDEGTATDETVAELEMQIMALLDRLQKLTGEIRP